MPYNASDFLVAPMDQRELNHRLWEKYEADSNDRALPRWHRGGFCWALSIAWTYQLLQYRASPIERIEQLCKTSYAESLDALQKQFLNNDISVPIVSVTTFAPLQRGLVTKAVLTEDHYSYFEKTKRAALHMNMSLVTDGYWGEVDGIWPLTQLKALLATREELGVLLTMHFADQTGHVVSCFHCPSATAVHYYDPNHGEFVCRFDDTMSMLLSIEQLRRNDPVQVIHWYVFRLFHSPAPT